MAKMWLNYGSVVRRVSGFSTVHPTWLEPRGKLKKIRVINLI